MLTSVCRLECSIALVAHTKQLKTTHANVVSWDAAVVVFITTANRILYAVCLISTAQACFFFSARTPAVRHHSVVKNDLNILSFSFHEIITFSVEWCAVFGPLCITPLLHKIIYAICVACIIIIVNKTTTSSTPRMESGHGCQLACSQWISEEPLTPIAAICKYTSSQRFSCDKSTRKE